MSEVKIARFVGIEACKSIFSEKSTFVLRSPEYYRRLYYIYEGDTDKGDEHEGSADTTDNGTGSDGKAWVVSCWTILKGDKPTSDDWNIFKKTDQNIVAIVSTPSKVCKFLEKVFKTNKERTERKFPFNSIEHDKVNYEKPIDPARITYDVPFKKKPKFSKQKEYRFVLRCCFPNIIDSLIIYRGIDYMEECFVNPNMSEEQKEELQTIMWALKGSDGDFEDKKMDKFIANFNDLF